MIKRIFLVVCILFLYLLQTEAQINYGTTGLMNMPTADMQRDKTVMAGTNWLNRHATVPRWWYDTWNYYINITIFPWLEAGYLCTGHKAVPVDYGNQSGYWVPSTYGKFINQDRSFHGRLRVWKEGWWKEWTPQIVLGANDPTTGSWEGGSSSNDQRYNGFFCRYYLAFTKHLPIKNTGELGIHLAYVYNKREDYHLDGPAFGANFRFCLPGEETYIKALNSLNLMAEYDSRTINVGVEYSFWKDYINAVIEFNRCQYFSGGLVFKIHLK